MVVAWTQPENGPCKQNVVPYLGVLNYNSKTPSNPAITSVRVDRADGAFYNTCNLEGYDYLVRDTNASSVPTNITRATSRSQW